MRTRPDSGSSGPVLFVSFSVLMTSLLGVLFLAACASDEDPSEPTPIDRIVVQPPPAPDPGTTAASDPVSATDSSAQAESGLAQEAPAPAPSEETDPFGGAEEMVIVGSGASMLFSETTTSSIAFDSDELYGLGASERPRRAPGGLKGVERKRFMSLGDPSEPSVAVNAFPPHAEANTERYDESAEQGFVRPSDAPRSTFSVDVDTASYANVRRFLRERTRPPVGAIRIEELVNYFRYPRRVAAGEAPFAVDMEIFEAPWRDEHRLVRIAIEGKEIPRTTIPPRNLVFLLDVSGSMAGPDRLDLVKYGMERLVETLRPIDRVSIVVYAGASGLVLPPTPGDEEEKIVEALSRLRAGGSTAGAAGLELAYRTAREHFDDEGINRVILATDGDFNVGVANRSELLKRIERERESGIELTVLGVGRGNLNDATMEQLADHGNGNYAYIDTRQEARKVLVEQADATLVTIAKDVKIQVEFNPKKVRAYRLIGYENRRLADQDFNDDTKDAGEIGAGHTVTALYVVVPVGVEPPTPPVDGLKYQQADDSEPTAAGDQTRAADRVQLMPDSNEMLTLKIRYKQP
ncbi:MAG: VWA domain-containing protein, partial [Myxococcota bacterium]